MIPPTVFHDSRSASTETEKATLFFHSVFTVSNPTLPSSDESSSCESGHDNIEISEEDVFKALFCLDPTKAMGPDEIGPRLLKFCSTALCEPLHYLFTKSLEQQALPSER